MTTKILRADKWLFLCSANIARSPTAEYLARKSGIIARSCGTGGIGDEHYSVTPMTEEILGWADVIVAMKMGHRIAAEKFKVARKKKIFVWALDDDWGVPYHPEMIAIMEPKLLETRQLYDEWLEEKLYAEKAEKAGRSTDDGTSRITRQE